jgi:hypothetical protein
VSRHSHQKGQQVVRVTCNLPIDAMTRCFKAAGASARCRASLFYDWNGQPWDKPYPGPDALQNDPGLAQNELLIAFRS